MASSLLHAFMLHSQREFLVAVNSSGFFFYLFFTSTIPHIVCFCCYIKKEMLPRAMWCYLKTVSNTPDGIIHTAIQFIGGNIFMTSGPFCPYLGVEQKALSCVAFRLRLFIIHVISVPFRSPDPRLTVCECLVAKKGSWCTAAISCFRERGNWNGNFPMQHDDLCSAHTPYWIMNWERRRPSKLIGGTASGKDLALIR